MITSLSRRDLLNGSIAAGAFSATTLATTLAAPSVNPLAPRQSHFQPKAKRVILLFMTGGASHVDTFDPKPALRELDGKDAGSGRIYTGSRWGWKKYGESGIEVSDLFPHVGKCVDDICMMRSLHGDKGDHFEATLSMHSGTMAEALPGIGAWVSYGLGTQNPNLPSHVVFAEKLPYAGAQAWDSNFLPAYHQGMRVTPGSNPIRDLSPDPATASLQFQELQLLQKMNQRHFRTRNDDDTLAARMYSFSAASGLQQKAPEVFDLSEESDETLQLYGIDREDRNSFGWQCLCARRMSERGVRFIEVVDKGNWDAHSKMASYDGLAKRVDQPIAALLQDLKRSGQLEETLVIWCTEFGRTPSARKTARDGRDHYKDAFTCWLAGGGVKSGYIHGATDEVGARIVENPVHIHDFHATIMHLLGFDHKKLTYHFSGRDYRLTGLAGNVVQDVIA